MLVQGRNIKMTDNHFYSTVKALKEYQKNGLIEKFDLSNMHNITTKEINFLMNMLPDGIHINTLSLRNSDIYFNAMQMLIGALIKKKYYYRLH